MNFRYTDNTEILINNKKHVIKMGNGMTGIGSRTFWLDGEKKPLNVVIQSEDITKGNHYLYIMKWRDTPWSKVYILIHEKELPVLLSEDNNWREPKREEAIHGLSQN